MFLELKREREPFVHFYACHSHFIEEGEDAFQHHTVLGEYVATHCETEKKGRSDGFAKEGSLCTSRSLST